MSHARPRRSVRAAAALLALAVVPACGDTSSEAGGGAAAGPGLSGTLTVFAAASLTGAFTDLGRQFESAHPGTTVRFSFGSSSTLAQQILAGAPADVFASASAATMEQVSDAGEVADPRTFATNAAEIAVFPGSASSVTGLADLAARDLKVALCQVQVPCGALARTVLDAAGVTVDPVTEGLDVKATLAHVVSGEADAAVVYVTDVVAAGSSVVGVEIPEAQNATTAYPVATVKASSNPALAGAFEDLVLSPAGQGVLDAAGFRSP